MACPSPDHLMQSADGIVDTAGKLSAVRMGYADMLNNLILLKKSNVVVQLGQKS